jgi:hypothetical protein
VITPQLNAVADEAAKVVQSVEKLLAKESSLGVTAETVRELLGAIAPVDAAGHCDA